MSSSFNSGLYPDYLQAPGLTPAAIAGRGVGGSINGGSYAHDPLVTAEHKFDQFMNAGTAPVLIGREKVAGYEAGRPIVVENEPLSHRVVKSATQGWLFNLLASNPYHMPRFLIIQALTQGRKGNNPLEVAQNIVHSVIPMALGTYVGLPLGHWLSQQMASQENKALAKVLTEDTTRAGLRALSNERVKQAERALRERQNALTQELTQRFPELVGHNTSFDIAETRLATNPRRLTAFINTVESLSRSELQGLELARNDSRDLGQAIQAFRTAEQKYHIHDARRMSEKLLETKSRLTSVSHHMAPEAHEDLHRLLDKSMGYLKPANDGAPLHVNFFARLKNEARLTKHIDKLRTAKNTLRRNGALPHRFKTDSNTVLTDLITQLQRHKADAYGWLSPQRMKERMKEMEQHKGVLYRLTQHFKREQLEGSYTPTALSGALRQVRQGGRNRPNFHQAEVMEQSLSNLKHLWHQLEVGQQLHKKVFRNSGAIVGFMAVAGIFAPWLTQKISSTLAHWQQQSHQFFKPHTPNPITSAAQGAYPVPGINLLGHSNDKDWYVDPSHYTSWVTDTSLGGQPWVYHGVK